jgi:putative FmdB family regulatory protein
MEKGNLMPIYQYLCGDCGHKTEEIRKFNERHEPAECDKCSSKNTKKVEISEGGTHILKGTGWARDRYK